MAQKQLNMVEAGSGFNQVGGKTMPQGMDVGRFGDAGLSWLVEELLYRMGGEVIFLFGPVKQPLLGRYFLQYCLKCSRAVWDKRSSGPFLLCPG